MIGFGKKPRSACEWLVLPLAASIALVIVLIAGRAAFIRISDRLDRQKAAAVLKASYVVSTYYFINKRLPSNIYEADRSIGWNSTDAGKSWDGIAYTVIGPTAFRLCTEFSKASASFDDVGAVVRYGDPVVHGYGAWIHGPGTQCIARSVLHPNAKRASN